nr:hypothetical protein [Haloferax sp. Atlit-4N]
MDKNVPVKAVKISLEVVDLIRKLDGAGVSELSREIDKPKVPFTTIYGR